MSRRSAAISPEQILNTRVGELPSRDEALQSRSRAPIDTTLASRPRTFDLVSEPIRATFEMGHDDSEQSHYIFTPLPSTAVTSRRNASRAFPTSTAVHLTPIAMTNPVETQSQEEAVQYEITQNGLKFKGNVKGIRIIATQVASKTGQYTSEYHQAGNEEQIHQSQSQGKQDNGFVNQNGARFFQSVTDTETEVSQSAGGKDFLIVTQDAVEVEGDVTGGSFINNQRVW